MNCGVRLASSEKSCPLCGLRAYHPDLPENTGAPLYPRQWSAPTREHSGLRFLLILLLLAATAVCLPVDLHLNGHVVWSGFVLCSLGAAYVVTALPLWFSRPNPAILVPVDFLAVGLLLLYIDLKISGGWFLSFAFPVTGIYGILCTVVVILARYVRKGYFFIFGGALIAFGCSSMLLELFQCITFGGRMFRWSLYPVAVLSAMGLFWILAGAIRPLGDAIRKRMFI